MSRRWSGLTVVGLTTALAVWVAPAAEATVTTSNITTPTDPTYALANDNNPNTYAISGTSDGTTGDQVDVRCYFTGSAFNTVSSGLTVQPDGTFSVPAADFANARNKICRLRAVPAGTVPGDLTPFAGPRLATGEQASYAISGGPNDGVVHEYYVMGQQLTAANDYDSYSSCALCDSWLYDSNFIQTTATFFENDSLRGENGDSTRSAVRVDNANSYGPQAAYRVNSAAGNFPALTWSVSQNPSNGNLTINESEKLVKCPDPAFPPDASSCPNFVDTGVRVDRTITQEEDGHLVLITDRYVSTDGHDHPLSLLPFNSQLFGNGTNVAYEFPGESSFSTHTLDDSVSFPDSSPGAVYVNVQGSADGATDTGQGAIVFDHPASPAFFSRSDGTELEFHETALATPSCSPSLSFAYAQDYLAANVQTVAQTALTRFNGSPATVCSPAPPPGPTPAGGPSGQRAAALKKCKHRHSARARKRCRKRAKQLPL